MQCFLLFAQRNPDLTNCLTRRGEYAWLLLIALLSFVYELCYQSMITQRVVRVRNTIAWARGLIKQKIHLCYIQSSVIRCPLIGLGQYHSTCSERKNEIPPVDKGAQQLEQLLARFCQRSECHCNHLQNVQHVARASKNVSYKVFILRLHTTTFSDSILKIQMKSCYELHS